MNKSSTGNIDDVTDHLTMVVDGGTTLLGVVSPTTCETSHTSDSIIINYGDDVPVFTHSHIYPWQT